MDLEYSECNSASSDNEFWETFEYEKIPYKARKNTVIGTNIHFPNLRQSERERYEKTITNIRDGRTEEIENLTIKIRNQTKKELFATVNEMKTNFQREAVRLQETFAESRSVIQKKDAEILKLIGKVGEQETLISELRIRFGKKKQKKEKNREKNGKGLEEVEKNGKEKLLQLQIEALKLVCEDYKQDMTRFKDLNQKLIEENQELLKGYEETKRELADLSRVLREKYQREKENALSELNKFKLQAEKELEVRELLNTRQQETIASLQEELKSAKIIINTPRIHFKAIEKLKDSILPSDPSKKIMKYKQNDHSSDFYKSKLKLPSNLSYKEYKPFKDIQSKASLLALRAVSITPRIDILSQNNSKLSKSYESRHKFSKNSILIY